jgi:hypothetical protein
LGVGRWELDGQIDLYRKLVDMKRFEIEGDEKLWGTTSPLHQIAKMTLEKVHLLIEYVV